MSSAHSKFQIYREGGVNRDWRWRLKARNGRIVADGGEGYRTRRGVMNAINRLFDHVDCALVEDLEERA